MGEENIKSEKETQYEKALREILNDNIDIQSQGKDVESLASEGTQFDKTNELLLKYYNERNESDFEKELKAQLTVDVYKKIKGRFDEIDKEANEKEQEEQIRDISKEALEGEQVDKDTQERAIKKAQKEASENLEQVDIKAEVMKAVYEEAFDKYSFLLEKYKKNQLKDESMTVGDKEGTELVLYERYLTNLERNYMGYAKAKGLDVRTLSDDPDIKAKKEKLEYDMKKITRSNDLAAEENLQRIKISSDKRNTIAEKMSELAASRENMSPEQFKQSMDYYQQQYFEKTVELRSFDPSLEEYKSQLEVENENKDFYDRKVGYAANNKVLSDFEAGDYQEIDAFGNPKEDLGDENLEQIQDIDEEYVKINQVKLEKLIKEAKEALAYGDIELATEIIESAQNMAGGREVSKRDSDEEMTRENDEQVKKDMEQYDESEQSNSFMQEMQCGVASEREAELQGRIRDLEKLLNKDKNEKDMQIDAYIRTRRFNNRKN